VAKEKARRTKPFCGFCGKSEGEVGRLVAGPGVFICDRCVGLCVAVIEADGDSGDDPDRASKQTKKGASARAKTSKPDFQNMSRQTEDDLLARMARVHKSRQYVDAAVGRFVHELRDRQVPWARIGQALGMTRQSAWERYSGEE
jgi:hypothetical protein